MGFPMYRQTYFLVCFWLECIVDFVMPDELLERFIGICLGII